MSPAAPISQARAEANRHNAQLSTGPKSAQGKSRVRLNGLRHGLTGNTVLMPGEDRTAYQTFVSKTVEALAPEGAAERALAQVIADDRWRLGRAHAIEENVFSLGAVTSPLDLDEDPAINAALTQAQTFLENAPQFQLLTLYAGRIDKTIRKNAAELRELQTARHAASEQEIAEATLLFKLHQAGKQSGLIPAHADWDGSTSLRDGFGFSKAFLDRRIDRDRRLAEAHAQFPAAGNPSKQALKGR